MRQAYSIDRHIVNITAAMAILLTGCGGGSTSSDGRSSGTAPGGATMPGNEAIPELGRLSRGGTATTNGVHGSMGGNTTATTGRIGAGTGGASSAGGSGTAIGGDTSQGGSSVFPTGGASATGGNARSSGGASGKNVGGQGTSTGNQVAAGGQTTTSSSNARGGASGNVTNTGGSVAAGGSVATGGSLAAGGSGAAGGSAAYHTLANWVSPEKNNKNHHGRMYFIANAQQDDQGLACSACHGTNLEGTSSAPACASCHSTWRSCSFCHGTGASQYHPPRGVFDESATSTLAVGRHAAHLSAASSHAAFSCATCHAVPAANDVTHLLSYKPSIDLTTPGHHGDVTFSGFAGTTTWNVNATANNPVSARGTCLGACHSNGRGGNPAKTPYWAGGTWTTGCTNCHGSTGSTSGHHGHGFPNSTCADCHTGATTTTYAAATHLNGTRDFDPSPSGRAAGMTLTANWNCSNVPCHSGD